MKRYIYNFNWLLAEKIIRIFGGLILTVWVSRYLGPSGFGVLCYALAFIGFFSWLTHLGLDDIVVRELTKYPDRSSLILGSAFGLKLVGALSSVILIVIVIGVVMPDDELVRAAVGLASLIYIFRSFDVIGFYYQARVLSKYAAIARNIAYILVLGLQVYFIVEKYEVLYFVAATVIDMFLASFFMLYLYKKTGHSIKEWKFSWPMAKELMMYSWPLMISIFLITVHMKIDQIMIGSMLSIEDVGIYSIAVRLSEFWYFIPTIIVSTLMPYFIGLKERDVGLYNVHLMQLLSGMFWLGMCVGIATLFAGDKVIILLFGNEYAAASDALLYNIWGGIFIAQGLACSIWVVAENRQLFRLYIQIMAVCANLFLNIMLIPALGISGAALSTFLTHFLATWVFGFIFRDVRPITLMMLQSVSPHYIFRFVREKFLG